MNEHPQAENSEAQAYLEKLQGKIDSLVERFAEGDLNRRQFENLHNHYRSEMEKIERAIEDRISPAHWKKQVAEGQTILIRRLNAARINGFAIYDKQNKSLLVTKGEYPLPESIISDLLGNPPAVVDPDLPEGVIHSKPIQGRWCCMIQGDLSLTIVILTEEPSVKQLHTLLELQGVFENANRNMLDVHPIPNHLLATPHHFFVNKEL